MEGPSLLGLRGTVAANGVLVLNHHHEGLNVLLRLIQAETTQCGNIEMTGIASGLSTNKLLHTRIRLVESDERSRRDLLLLVHVEGATTLIRLVEYRGTCSCLPKAHLGRLVIRLKIPIMEGSIHPTIPSHPDRVVNLSHILVTLLDLTIQQVSLQIGESLLVEIPPRCIHTSKLPKRPQRRRQHQ